MTKNNKKTEINSKYRLLELFFRFAIGFTAVTFIWVSSSKWSYNPWDFLDGGDLLWNMIVSFGMMTIYVVYDIVNNAFIKRDELQRQMNLFFGILIIVSIVAKTYITIWAFAMILVIELMNNKKHSTTDLRFHYLLWMWVSVSLIMLLPNDVYGENWWMSIPLYTSILIGAIDVALTWTNFKYTNREVSK